MQLIDDLFQMGGGYVLYFSDRTFVEFSADELGVDIYSPGCDAEGGSKAKRLKYFLKTSAPEARSTDPICATYVGSFLTLTIPPRGGRAAHRIGPYFRASLHSENAMNGAAISLCEIAAFIVITRRLSINDRCPVDLLVEVQLNQR